MSKYQAQTGNAFTSALGTLPPVHQESKRDRKRRETINKVQALHEESWQQRDERFSALYREFHNENKSVNTQPPTSQKYLLRIYPHTIERDALLEEAEIEYQYKSGQARKMYESERETIEAQYWDSRDQVKQRLIANLEDRRRRLREEKEGGDNISESLLDAASKQRPARRLPFRKQLNSAAAASGSGSGRASRAGTPLVQNGSTAYSPPSGFGSTGTGAGPSSAVKPADLLLHQMLAPTLATVSLDDIIPPNSTSLVVLPPAINTNATHNKRGPRGKGDAGANGDKDAMASAAGALNALAAVTGQVGNAKTSRNAAGANPSTIFGRSVAELQKMTSASQLEIESDWARINGATGRGRRGRAEQ